MVTVSNGIQYWTVPYSGTYQITAVGAAGGYDINGPGPRGIFTFSIDMINLSSLSILTDLVNTC
jgi:hypothetical protein